MKLALINNPHATIGQEKNKTRRIFRKHKKLSDRQI